MSDEKRRDDYMMDMDKEKVEERPRSLPTPSSQSLTNSPGASVFAYCMSSILMTVTNKYVLSGTDYNLNFLLLAVQVSSSLDRFR